MRFPATVPLFVTGPGQARCPARGLASGYSPATTAGRDVGFVRAARVSRITPPGSSTEVARAVDIVDLGEVIVISSIGRRRIRAAPPGVGLAAPPGVGLATPPGVRARWTAVSGTAGSGPGSRMSVRQAGQPGGEVIRAIGQTSAEAGFIGPPHADDCAAIPRRAAAGQRLRHR